MLADSIYFLMFEGWPRELRSNRWHYASRWARHLPVVLVQPVLTSDSDEAVSEVESRIPNCRVLKVRATDSWELPSAGALQGQQILRDMQSHGFGRPILWTYSADYLVANALIPAVARVHHATENYFYFDNLSSGFLHRLKRILGITDLVIAVSEGVAASHRPFAKGTVVTITNGCDYAFYAQRGTDEYIVRKRDEWNKIIAYAGNINGRLDFDLLHAAAGAYPDALFLFRGPVSGLNAGEQRRWRELMARPNVEYLGVAGISELPAFFASADVGLIPYTNEPILVDNTFPLKAFEMQAAGLPVVSTFLSALESEQSPGLRIARDVASFVRLVGEIDRRKLSEGERQEIESKSQKHDYDHKFQFARALVEDVLAKSGAPKAFVQDGNCMADLCGYVDKPTSDGKVRPIFGRYSDRAFQIARRWARRSIPSVIRQTLVKAFFS